MPVIGMGKQAGASKIHQHGRRLGIGRLALEGSRIIVDKIGKNVSGSGFDTNAVASALLFHAGRLSWLRGAWRAGRSRPAVPECRDPFDRPFLELAIVGRADALVTGDAEILALADAFPVRIPSPAAFRRRVFPGEGADG